MKSVNKTSVLLTKKSVSKDICSIHTSIDSVVCRTQEAQARRLNVVLLLRDWSMKMY